MSQKNPTALELRVFAGGLLILAGIALLAEPSWLRDSWRVGITVVLVGCGSLGVFLPETIRWIYRTWMSIVTPIGWLISHLVMAAIYFLIITPIGLGRRLLGADALTIRKPSGDSDWLPIPQNDDPKRSFRQY